MPSTTWNGRTIPTTTWNGRTIPTTTWSNLRLGGAYLVNTLGEYILTANSEKIIVIVPGGDLPTAIWTARTPI